jgi:hypothetical protein
MNDGFRSMMVRVGIVWAMAAVALIVSWVRPASQTASVPLVVILCVFLCSEVHFQWKMRSLQRERAETWKADAEAWERIARERGEMIVMAMTSAPKPSEQRLDVN